MEIINIVYKTKCDFSGCKNMAEIEIKDETDSRKKMVFCKSCLDNMFNSYLKITVPKAVEAPFKKQKNYYSCHSFSIFNMCSSACSKPRK